MNKASKSGLLALAILSSGVSAQQPDPGTGTEQAVGQATPDPREAMLTNPDPFPNLEGSGTVRADALADNGAQIATEMHEVAARQQVPFEFVRVADAIGTWRGIGEREQVDAVISMAYRANGTILARGKGAPIRTTVKDYVEELDFVSPGFRMIPADGPIQVYARDKTWTETGAPGMSPSDASPAGGVARAYNGIYPHGFMRFLKEPGARVRIGSGGKVLAVTVKGQTFTAKLDGDYRPASITTSVRDPILGSGTLVAEYSDYKPDFHALYTPRHIVRKLNGKVIADLTITSTPRQNLYVAFPEPEVLRRAAATAPVVAQ